MLPCYHVTMLVVTNASTHEALQWRVAPHCAVALLEEVPPWGVMLRLSDHACCQLLCNSSVTSEPSSTGGISLLPPLHQGRPRERGRGGSRALLGPVASAGGLGPPQLHAISIRLKEKPANCRTEFHNSLFDHIQHGKARKPFLTKEGEAVFLQSLQYM